MSNIYIENSKDRVYGKWKYLELYTTFSPQYDSHRTAVMFILTEVWFQLLKSPLTH